MTGDEERPSGGSSSVYDRLDIYLRRALGEGRGGHFDGRGVEYEHDTPAPVYELTLPDATTVVLVCADEEFALWFEVTLDGITRRFEPHTIHRDEFYARVEQLLDSNHL